MRPLKILFVWSAAEFSTFDVARGYSAALKRQGHEVYDFRLYNRIKYHGLALQNDPLDKRAAVDSALVSRLASEGMVVEALRFRVDLVVAVSAMGLHPDGLELLSRAGFPLALIFTEAPYDDAWHLKFARHAAHVFVNERSSAREQGWGYLAAAYDPELHRPSPRSRREACDVLIVGTGWAERQALLEAVDWSGVRLRVLGWWDGIKAGSPLWPFYEQGPIDNRRAARLYSSAKVCINQHRSFPGAESLNPRAFELAACGAFQVSDRRSELSDVFAGSVPVYQDGRELQTIIRHFVSDGHGRKALAREQRAKVLSGGHTFDDRAATMMAAITNPGGDDGATARAKRPLVPAGGGG